MPTATINISSTNDKQILDITARIEDWLSKSGIEEGLCHVFVAHTTACITTGEAIEGTDEDLMETLHRMIPPVRFRHAHDPQHAPDHMISSIIGPSLTVPIRSGKLLLGTWQRVLFVETNGPRNRTVVLTAIDERTAQKP
jgi:secondary thiamine-phosphate synthase enzyme